VCTTSIKEEEYIPIGNIEGLNAMKEKQNKENRSTH
jgi:hypothetical protein